MNKIYTLSKKLNDGGIVTHSVAIEGNKMYLESVLSQEGHNDVVLNEDGEITAEELLGVLGFEEID